MPAPLPPPPRPATRRVIFLDVENGSRPQHLAHIIDHLALDYRESTAELFAVANWKVVSHESARLLAQRGAQLVHSAPSTGVRDWSDLRIAVAAGIWLAAARAGDTIEIVSDDRAFDAVGDVAASLGVAFRRLSYRRLVREEAPELERPTPSPPPEGARDGRGRRRRRGGRRRDGRPALGAPRPSPVLPAVSVAAPPDEPPAGEPHTAPHDEIVSIIRELVDASPARTVSLDTLANALKARGFRRTPGSPRLVTRLRRIREVAVSQSGVITLRDGSVPAPVGWPPAGEPADESDAAPAAPSPTGEPGRGRRRRRRRRRGGRRGQPQPAPVA
jgi:hypothetical protein